MPVRASLRSCKPSGLRAIVMQLPFIRRELRRVASTGATAARPLHLRALPEPEYADGIAGIAARTRNLSVAAR